MEENEARQSTKGARQPALQQIHPTMGHNGTTQERRPEQSEASCNGGALHGMVAAMPDALADQGSQSTHQSLRANAATSDLGDRCPDQGPFVVSLGCNIRVAELLEGLHQFRQQ